MSKKTVLLVITSDNMLSEDSKAKLIAYAQPVADQLNAELLVLGNGQGAELLVVPGAQATNDQTALETATARVVRKVSDSLQMGQSFGSSVIRAEDLQAEMQPGEALTATTPMHPMPQLSQADRRGQVGAVTCYKVSPARLVAMACYKQAISIPGS